MSLVNEMLKDLEQRHEQVVPPLDMPTHSIESAGSSNLALWLKLALGAVMLVVLAVVGLWKFLPWYLGADQRALTEQLQQQRIEQLAIEQAKYNQPAVGDVKLQRVSSYFDGEYLNIEIQSDQQARYRMMPQRDYSLVLELSNISANQLEQRLESAPWVTAILFNRDGDKAYLRVNAEQALQYELSQSSISADKLSMLTLRVRTESRSWARSAAQQAEARATVVSATALSEPVSDTEPVVSVEKAVEEFKRKQAVIKQQQSTAESAASPATQVIGETVKEVAPAAEQESLPASEVVVEAIIEASDDSSGAAVTNANSAESPAIVVKRVAPVLPAEKDRQAVLQAQESVRAGRLKQAEAQLTRFIDKNAQAPDATFFLVALLQQQQRWSDAEQVLALARQHYPADPRVAKFSARRLIAESKLEAAKAQLAPVAQQASVMDLELLEMYAAICQQQGDYTEAVVSYQRLIKQQPRNSRYWVGLGIAKESAGYPNHALLAYESALKFGLTDSVMLKYVMQRTVALKKTHN